MRKIDLVVAKKKNDYGSLCINIILQKFKHLLNFLSMKNFEIFPFFFFFCTHLKLQVHAAAFRSVGLVRAISEWWGGMCAQFENHDRGSFDHENMSPMFHTGKYAPKWSCLYFYLSGTESHVSQMIIKPSKGGGKGGETHTLTCEKNLIRFFRAV